MLPTDWGEVLDSLSKGDPVTLSRPMPAVYDELRKIARRHLRRERRDHTLQTTALVNEVYLRFAGQSNVRWQNRAHFMAAAHLEGIVHRDFKSANIMLVPVDDDAGKLRAIVTDFGVARADAGPADDTDTLTVPGTFIGTPAYVAREQIGGGKATSAEDIYSLGVVLYEMVTGKRPFSGHDAISSALNRLKEPPVRPRQRGANIDARWEEVILRCLETDPADRFADVRDVARALRGEHVAPGGKQRQRRKRIAIGAIAAALLVGALLSGIAMWRDKHPVATEAAQVRPSVAVLKFKNSSGRPDAEWLATALPEMLSSELAAGEKTAAKPGDGRYHIALQIGEDYAFRAAAAGYVAVSDRIDLVKAKDGDRFERNLSVRRISLSAITVEEIHFGLAWRPNERIGLWMEDFLRRHCEILPVGMEICLWAGRMRGQLRRKGINRTQADMLIAGTAAIHGLTLVTRYDKDFSDCGIAVHNPFAAR